MKLSRVVMFGVPQKEFPLISLTIWTQFQAEPLWDEVFSDRSNIIFLKHCLVSQLMFLN